MKKFIVERNVLGAGRMTEEELQAISRTSNAVISVLGRPYTWIESFVTTIKSFAFTKQKMKRIYVNMRNAETFLLTRLKK